MRTWPGAGLLAGISPRLGRNCEPSRLGQALCVYSGIVRRLSSHAGISTPSFARRISRRSSSSVHDELNEERNELPTGVPADSYGNLVEMWDPLTARSSIAWNGGSCLGRGSRRRVARRHAQMIFHALVHIPDLRFLTFAPPIYNPKYQSAEAKDGLNREVFCGRPTKPVRLCK